MNETRTQTQTLRDVCNYLEAGEYEEARLFLHTNLPMAPSDTQGKRKYSKYQITRVFVRDGFIDRYTGDLLVFPGALRLLSHLMPDEFPYHPNWKVGIVHQAYWELYPTIDHVVPVAHNGSDSEDNLVCCSQLSNSRKAHWTLEEMDWSLLPPGDLSDWDGLLYWFMDYCDAYPTLRKEYNHFREWYSAGKRALQDTERK